MTRNYRKEYDNYQGTPAQIKKRASRNKARSILVAQGRASKGDGKDVDHKDGNPLNNAKGNLRMMSASKNRSRKYLTPISLRKKKPITSS